ncbi:MAG: hypothetical protein WC657_06520 [Candidatus Paceibacterota bacterium]|jgi:hypothetical protein
MKSNSNLYLSPSTLASYDGEGVGAGPSASDLGLGAGQPGGQAAGQPGGQPGGAAHQGGTPKVWTQEDVNRFLADDRRKHVQKYEELEGAYKEALENQTLTAEQRAKLQEQLEGVQARFRSKEQQLEMDKKTLEDRYSQDTQKLKESVVVWEAKYKSAITDRALLDAAVTNDAFNPNQIVGLLRPMTRMVEYMGDDGRPTGELIPMVDFPDVDTNTGESIMTRRTPEEAVKRMKELAEQYGNLFKSNVVSGIGAGSATGGLAPGADGRVDPRKITTEQYMKLRKENPAALGLRTSRSR